MGIGAADPDSVMVVQRIDAEGRVAQSWVRNPDHPDQIWSVQGEYYPKPGGSPPPESVIRTLRLSIPQQAPQVKTTEKPRGFFERLFH